MLLKPVQAGAALIGGETAEMPGMVKTTMICVSAVGIAENLKSSTACK